MAISDRIESIEEHLRDDYSVLEVAGADLTNVDKNILNLKPTWKERLLYFMNNGTDEVWDNWEKVVGEGTTITLNNTEEAPMSLVYKGNTYQDSTTGKNKCVFTTGSVLITGATYNGSEIRITGTYSGNQYQGFNKIKLPAGSYIFSFEYSWEGSSTSIPYFLVNGQSTYPIKTKTFTLSEETEITMGLVLYAGTYNNAYIKAQIETGITATSYEPYTNGASPNPDYPQDIHVVSGDNSIVVGNGKNIFNMKEYASANSSYFTYSSSTGLTAIAKDNRATANVNYPIEVDTNTTYYIKTDTDKRLLIAQFNSNNVWITNNEVFNGDSFKPNANASYIRVKVADTLTSFPTIVGNVYISTSSDYTGESYPISLGVENLLNIEKFLTDKSTQYIKNGDGSFSIINKTELYTQPYVFSNTDIYVSLSGIIDNGSATNVRVQLLNSSDSVVGEITSSVSKVENKLASKIRFNWSTGGIFSLKEIMVNKGDTSKPYTPYGKNIELCKIGDYQDKIFKNTPNTTDYDSNLEDNVWYLKKEIGKVVLDGSENWFQNGTYPNVYGIDNFLTDATTIETRPMLSDYFTYGGLINSGSGSVAINKFYQWISMPKRLILGYNSTSLADFKTWMGNNNVEIIYPLATPTYTEITDSTLLSQLEAVKRSYDRQTNITQTNTDLPFILDATALKEMA